MSTEPRIVHSDEAIVVVDKPPGLVVHPAGSHKGVTLVDLLEGLGGGEKERPGIVHRLDKDTSGLMVVARNEEAQREAFAAAGLDVLELSTSDDLVDAVLRFAHMRTVQTRLGGGGNLPAIAGA